MSQSPLPERQPPLLRIPISDRRMLHRAEPPSRALDDDADRTKCHGWSLVRDLHVILFEPFLSQPQNVTWEAIGIAGDKVLPRVLWKAGFNQ